MNVTEAEIIRAAQAAERAVLAGKPGREASVLVDALDEGHRIVCDLLTSRTGSRAVEKIWRLSADELRLLVLSQLIATTAKLLQHRRPMTRAGPERLLEDDPERGIYWGPPR